MEGIQSFLKMQEIDRHVGQDAEWWRGEGLDPALIADVLRSVARRISPISPISEMRPSWAEHWDAARPRSSRAP